MAADSRVLFCSIASNHNTSLRLVAFITALVGSYSSITGATPQYVAQGQRFDAHVKEQLQPGPFVRNIALDTSVSGWPSASSEEGNSPAIAAIDNDENTAWRGAKNKRMWSWVLPFHKVIHLGMLRFRFGDSAARGVPAAFRWESQKPIDGQCDERGPWETIAQRDDRDPNEFVYGPMHIHVERQVAYINTDSCSVRLVVPETTANDPEGPPVLREVQVFEGARSVTLDPLVNAGDGEPQLLVKPVDSRSWDGTAETLSLFSSPANVLDGKYESLWMGQPSKQSWELTITLPSPRIVDRIYLVLGFDATTVPHEDRSGDDYSVAFFPRTYSIETSGTDRDDDYQPVVELPQQSQSSLVPLVRRRLITLSSPRPVKRLRITMADATDFAGVHSGRGVPVVRQLSIYEAQDTNPVIVPPVFLSVNANPSELTNNLPGGESRYDSQFARDFYHRLRRIVLGVDVDTHHTADVSVKRGVGSGKFIEAIEGDDPNLGPYLVENTYPRPALILSGSLDWEFDAASYPWPGDNHHYRWNVAACAESRDRGMGNLLSIVQRRAAPILGFCGGAQILAFLDSLRDTKAVGHREIDRVLSRLGNKYIRDRVLQPWQIERAWWFDPKETDASRPVVHFDPSDDLFDTLVASGDSRNWSSEFPLSHLDMIRYSAFHGPLDRFRLAAWSHYCSPYLDARGPEPIWQKHSQERCLTVPQAFYDDDGDFPSIGLQFHPEQRDFQRLASGATPEHRGDAMNVIGNAIWMMTDSYLGRKDVDD